MGTQIHYDYTLEETMKGILKLAMITGLLTVGTLVFAQQSEWQDKIQEDLDGYKARIVENCGTSDKLTLKFEGKLTCNPRENCGKEYGSVSTLCTSGTDALNVCQNNKVVKKAMGKVTSIVCTKGKGTLSYKLAGGKLTFAVDPAYEKNNASGQENDLVEKMKADLDK
jgi:hypothetical protein